MSRPISSESVFRAIAHPTRRRILELVANREWAACDLATQFNHTQPTLSNHLRILNNAGLVQHQRRGRNLHYRIAPGWIESISMWVTKVAGAAKQSPSTRSDSRGDSSEPNSYSTHIRDLWATGQMIQLAGSRADPKIAHPPYSS